MHFLIVFFAERVFQNVVIPFLFNYSVFVREGEVTGLVSALLSLARELSLKSLVKMHVSYPKWTLQLISHRRDRVRYIFDGINNTKY